MHRKTQISLRIKKAQMNKYKLKAMLIVFFGIERIKMNECVPQGQMVNEKYYISILIKFRE